ncbi:MAG: MBL fold metallo-hydrolase [Myxococcota bacterium]
MHRLPCLSLCAAALACAPKTVPTATPPAATEPTTACTPVDTSTAPEITRFVEGGLTIHSFVAPAVSASTATHVIESDEGLIVVDTQMLRDYARQFRAYVDGLDKPITHVIVSHAHPDHYFGLEFFEDRPTYALPATRQQVRQRQRFHLRMHRETEQECDAVTDRVRPVANDLPTGAQTFAGVQLQIEHAKDAEDNDQAVLRIPAAKTLILQDLMATDAHAFTGGGMVDGWREHLRRYADDPEIEHVLAGHGSPTDREGIVEMIAYLGESQKILENASTASQFTAAMQSAFPGRPGTYIIDLMGMMEFDQP